MSRRNRARENRRYESVLPGRSAEPTSAIPGSEEKIRILIDRAGKRQELHVAGDVVSDPEKCLWWRQAGNGAKVVDGPREQRAEPGEGIEALSRSATFGDRLQQCREHAGLTVLGLSRRTGISTRHLYHLESGDRQPTLPVVLLLCDVLGVSLAALAGRL